MTNIEKMYHLTSPVSEKLKPYEVYGKLMVSGFCREKSADEKMLIIEENLDQKEMEIVGFDYPSADEQYVSSDLTTIESGKSYQDYGFRFPRLIVRPKPKKKYRYVTDAIARHPKHGDYLHECEMVEYKGEYKYDYPRLCFTREEVKD